MGMVSTEMSCNPQKLRQALRAARAEIACFYGLTPQEKEDILDMVLYRFEVDKGRFPVKVYARHARDKVVGLLTHKRAKKRCAQKVVDGKVVYIEDESLNRKVDEDGEIEFGDTIPKIDMGIHMVELMEYIKKECPELLPLVKKVLDGERLRKKERELLKENIRREDLLG